MRAPAPPYRGESPHALWHVSEDPTITRFAPHRAKTALTDEELVWAVDTRHLPLFWYPRDCPRCTFWAGPRTTDADAARFLGGDRSLRSHVIEERWFARLRAARLHLYRMPEETFAEHPEVAGYWVSRAAVEPLEVVTIDDLVGRHAAAGIALRAEPNLWPLWDAVVASSRVQRDPSAECTPASRRRGKVEPIHNAWHPIRGPRCGGSRPTRSSSRSCSGRCLGTAASSVAPAIGGC